MNLARLVAPLLMLTAACGARVEQADRGGEPKDGDRKVIPNSESSSAGSADGTPRMRSEAESEPGATEPAPEEIADETEPRLDSEESMQPQDDVADGESTPSSNPEDSMQPDRANESGGEPPASDPGESMQEAEDMQELSPPELPLDETRVEWVDDADSAVTDFGLPEDSSAFIWGRGIGNWFVTQQDGDTWDAHRDEVDPPRDEGRFAFHLTSDDPPMPADLWAQLYHPEGWDLDLSAYAGFAFWARLESPTGELGITVGSGAYSGDRVSDLQAVRGDLYTLTISEEWGQYLVLFEDLGTDATSVGSLDFVVGLDGGAFDLWVDDLALVCWTTCPDED